MAESVGHAQARLCRRRVRRTHHSTRAPPRGCDARQRRRRNKIKEGANFEHSLCAAPRPAVCRTLRDLRRKRVACDVGAHGALMARCKGVRRDRV